MYLRTTKVKRANGRVDEYIRLVESYWNQGSPRHRIICNLGRKDLLEPHADALLRPRLSPSLGLCHVSVIISFVWVDT